MKLKRPFLIEFIILLATFFFVNPGFSQIRKEKLISFEGAIESVSQDFKFIVVNEVKIFISSTSTQISNDGGNTLMINDLKPKLRVAIEALRNPNGVTARKIVIKTSKRKR